MATFQSSDVLKNAYTNVYAKCLPLLKNTYLKCS